jgi:hypothetical protein
MAAEMKMPAICEDVIGAHEHAKTLLVNRLG